MTDTAANPMPMPEGGGTIRGLSGSFHENEFAGEASFQVPVFTSPCRDFEPKLSLTYRSGEGNGIFGLGFELSLPSISRKTSKGIPKYGEADTFTLNGEDLVPLADAAAVQRSSGGNVYSVVTYRPRVDHAYDRIERWVGLIPGDTYWRVTDKSNVTSLFGTTAMSRIGDPEDENRVFQWLLTESFDAKGNRAVYEYEAERLQDLPFANGEANRTQGANRYLRTIRYGNVQPYREGQPAANSDSDWYFRIVFDYGDYALPAEGGANPIVPLPAIPADAYRQDPFSTYYAGFEIRNHRLCRNILLFHRFANDLGVDPVLVHATRLLYRESPIVTLLASVESIGFRYEAGRYTSESVPPLEFFYREFEPDKGRYALLADEKGNPIPGLGFSNGWQTIDLYGAGVPGLLYHDGATTLYRELQKTGTTGDGNETLQYGMAEPLSFIPQVSKGRDEHELRLDDLNGNGRLDWMIRTPELNGFYEANPDRTWNAFRPLDTVPNVMNGRPYYTVDATGDGLSDMLQIEDDRVIVYPSRGTEGHGPPLVCDRPYGLPIAREGATNEKFEFADMTGIGIKQLVRVTNGKVECWPSLGYGVFGKPVTIAGAPYIDDDIDASRLFLADVNGTGLSDLIYVHSDRVDIYLNQSGNSFGDPIRIALPARWSRLSQLQFADVTGSGTTSLLFSEELLEPRHWCCDFSQGQKPYLLTRIANNIGSETRISYCGSSTYYLADARAGVPWIVNLPFPMQVVDRVEEHDFVSGTKEISTYVYHHGCYDAVEREFRGFGMVERFDAESLMEGFEPTDVPPVWTKTWYHTGNWELSGSISRQYASEYDVAVQGTDQLPDSVFLVDDYRSRHPDFVLDGETAREASRALKGATLREEVFSPSSPAEPGQDQNAPYRVTESNYEVRLVQPPSGSRYGIYTMHHRETLTFDCERMIADPRVVHEMDLETDDYGNVLRACSIAYGRDPEIENSLPEQQVTLIKFESHRYANKTDDDAYLLGVPVETLTYDIRNLILPAGQRRFRFEDAEKALVAVADGVDTPLVAGERHDYWSAEQNAVLPLGSVNAQALPYASHKLYFSPSMLQNGFGNGLSKDEATQLLESAGGYYSDADYWWAFDHACEYGGTDSFCLASALVDSFGHRTTLRYDSYGLLKSSMTDALQNTVVMEQGDYAHLLPKRIMDRNRNVSEVLYDALGRVRVASRYAADEGKAGNFIPLANYVDQGSVELSQLAGNPGVYLQGVAHYFDYDSLSFMGSVRPADLAALGFDAASLWQELLARGYISYSGGVTERFREAQSADELLLSPAFEPNRQAIWDCLAQAPCGQPISAVSLDAVQYADSNAAPSTRIRIDYSDGAGRLVQHKQLVEPGEAFLIADPLHPPSDGEAVPVGSADPRWLATGRTIYNNKGQPVKQYEPYFVNTPEFVDCETLNRFGVSSTHEYDPLGREFRVTSAKGFVKRIDRAPWEETDWDGIDTLPESPFYSANISGSDPDSPYYEPNLTDEERQTMDKAALLAHTPERKRYDALGRTVQFISYKDSDHTMATRHEWDLTGNLLASADPRLGKAGFENFRYGYSLANQHIRKDSADEGSTQWTLWNAIGLPIYSEEGIYRKWYSYDELHRLLSVTVQSPGNPAQIVESLVYGESLDVSAAQASNRRGELYRRFDQSGLTQIDAYSIDGHPTRTSIRMAKNYRDTQVWSSSAVEDFESELEDQTFAETFVYDALGQLDSHTDAANNQTNWKYGLAGWLLRAEMQEEEISSPPLTFEIRSFNARGQRLEMTCGSDGGTVSTYVYDPKTFDLIRIRTKRADSTDLQDLSLFYDPLSHVSLTQDRAHPALNEASDSPVISDYGYDTLYRLIRATGWESAQATGGDVPLRGYSLDYRYDDSDNLYEAVHGADAHSDGTPVMTLTVSTRSNRAVSAALTTDAEQVDSFFDASGCQKKDETLSEMNWDYDRRLLTVIPLQGNSRDYYVYDANGHRMRKVTETSGPDGAIAMIEETRYIGHLEINSRYEGSSVDPAALTEQVETVRLMLHHRNIASRIRWKKGNPEGERAETNPVQDRYSLHDQIGSCVIEADGEGNVLTQEGYYPYGGTAWVADSDDALKLKKLRFAGKEKDETTGLYDYGQRYYSPSSSRWLSPDPAGTVDGLNLYAYVRGNPVTFTDPNGLAAKADFTVTVAPRTAGGYKLVVIGRPKKFSTVTLRNLAARPGYSKFFTDNTGTSFKKAGYTRNHIQAWFTISKEHRTATRGFSLKQMESYLRNDIDASTFNNKIYKNRFTKILAKKNLSQGDIASAFHAVIVDEYNNADNLYIGKVSANSSGGSIMKHRHTKLKKTYGTKVLSQKQRDVIIKEFLKAGLDTPSYFTPIQTQEAQDRFDFAWGRNPGKYIK